MGAWPTKVWTCEPAGLTKRSSNECCEQECVDGELGNVLTLAMESVQSATHDSLCNGAVFIRKKLLSVPFYLI